MARDVDVDRAKQVSHGDPEWWSNGELVITDWSKGHLQVPLPDHGAFSAFLSYLPEQAGSLQDVAEGQRHTIASLKTSMSADYLVDMSSNTVSKRGVSLNNRSHHV